MEARRLMEWTASDKYMGGVPRRIVFAAVGLFAKTVTTVLNKTSVLNGDTLIRLVRSRPQGLPLITVSNHMSTLDDPLLWGFSGFPTMDYRSARWVLAAQDICFRNSLFSYFFRLGKCIPITRGGGINQEHMDEALERLMDGDWLHTFPEGKVSQEGAPVKRLKWGTASLIVRAPSTPIVLPIVHHGFHEVFPEKHFFGRRPLFPLCHKNVKIIVGEPMEFDIPKLRELAFLSSREFSCSSAGWSSKHELDETAQKRLLTMISDEIQVKLENLRSLLITS